MIAADTMQHSTGYSNVARSLAWRLVRDGHTVAVFGAGGFANGQFTYRYRGYEWECLAGCFHDARGGDDAYPYWRDWFQPDLIIALLDPCVLEVYGLDNIPTIFWCPIDSSPVNVQEAGILGRADILLVPSKWGQDQLKQVGLQAQYVPYGFEPDEIYFDFAAREKFRDSLGINDDTFLIGMIGVHYQIPDRKGYPYAFETIGNLSRMHDNIKAYIQTELKTGEDHYLDLRGVRDTMGLGNIIGFSRSLGPRYLTTEEMRGLISGFDVLLQSSMSEGFCIPAMELQAVGTPVVLNYATALVDLVGPLAVAAQPAGGMIGPDGGMISIPDVNGLTEGLELVYQEWANDKLMRNNKWAYDNYNWDMLYDRYWRPILNNIPKPLNISSLKDKLVLGCGGKPKENAVNLDLTKHHDYVDVAHDLNNFPYPFEDNQFNLIECEDVLEHLKCNVIDYMNECHRILRSEGYMLIVTVESGSWQERTDPTHERGFTLNSFDYFSDQTVLGNDYGTSYTDRRWKIIKKGMTPAGELLFLMQVIK